jgi:hypothetical protein
MSAKTGKRLFNTMGYQILSQGILAFMIYFADHAPERVIGTAVPVAPHDKGCPQ